MRAISHGSTSGPSTKKDRNQVLDELGTDLEGQKIRDKYFFDQGKSDPTFPICHMFPDLAADKNSLIPESDQTVAHLEQLGSAMRDKKDDFATDPNSIPEFTSIPSGYTYFSQLVNHDITFTDVTKPDGVTDDALLSDPQLKPWTDEMIAKLVTNKRDSVLQLDCVYGSMQAGVLAPRNKERPDLMALGTICEIENGSVVMVKDSPFDLVRCAKSEDRKTDRTALIADRRNDSNVILSQLQVAFLRAHNEIVEQEKCSFAEAQSMLQKHYQWLVLHDFLPKIVPQAIIEDVLAHPKFDAKRGVPFEFSMGAFRFGHSMIRRSYYLNDRVMQQTLAELFTVMVLRNFNTKVGVGFPTLPGKRVIKWANFVAAGASNNNLNVARALRTQMVDPLFELFDDTDHQMAGLAVQDLKRAYMMRIPTGQALAQRLEIPAQDRLTTADIEKVATADQIQILKDADFLEHTPLPFYVLAEAVKAKNEMLGPVGARIVAETVIGILRTIPGSCVNDANWKPHLVEPRGRFVLSDLFRLAKVL